MQNTTSSGRIWELDFFRGIALILMIYFHVIYDMKEIYGYNADYSTGINFYIGKASAILFMFISGISSSLSRSNIKRGLKVLALALIITLATWFYDPKFVIVFGILHFLAVCMLLSAFIMRFNQYLIWGIGTIVLVLGVWVKEISVSFDYLFIIGISSSKFISSDYYPLIPWMGIFLYGLGFGKALYKRKKSIFGFQIRDNIVSLFGKRTLIIYLLHQPAIMVILALLAYIS